MFHIYKKIAHMNIKLIFIVGLRYFSSKRKDKKKGWYIYYWTFKHKHLKFLLNNMNKEKIQRLKDRLDKELKRKRHSWIIWNLANIISFSRMLTPIILFAFPWSIKVKLFCYIGFLLTDFFDGECVKILGMDKLLFGSLIGLLISLLALWLEKQLRKQNNK